MAALLLGRLSTTTQAGVQLARRGFTHEAAALVRLSFEVFVLLRACCEQDGFWRRYRDSDLVRQRKLASGGQQLSTLSHLERDRFKRSEERLKREIARRGAKEIKVEETARSLGMADEYNSVYRLTCPAVHAAPVVLVDQIRHQNGHPAEVVFGPSREYLELHLHTLTEYLLRGTGCAAGLFSVDCRVIWKRIYGDLRKRKPALPERWTSDDIS